jgi:vitamin B12 transporter
MIGGIYNIKPVAIKIKGSYGTSFRAPTLNELFYKDSWGSAGNLNLRPEKSNSWEIGLEKEIIKEKASISITYFDQDYEDLIQWVESPPGSWQYTPQNVAKAEVKGIEAGASIKITETLTLKSSYTNLHTEDKETGERLPLRPKDKFNLSTEFSTKDMSVIADYTFVSERYDSSVSRNLSSYSLVNLSSSYKMTKGLTIFARVDNLFDEDYEEAGSYGTPGFSIFGGIRMSI